MHELTASYVNEETGYEVFLQDEEDLLSDSEEAMLVEDMKPVTEYGNCAFESADVTRGSTYEYVKDNYSGYFRESGTLFIIDMGNRHINLYSSGDIEKIVTPSYANSITDNTYRYASEGDYYTCASTAYSQVNTLLSGGRIAQPMKYISCALLALICAFLINYIILRMLSKNTKTPQAKIMAAIAATALVGSMSTTVPKRVRHSSSHSGGGGGGFSGGGGGGGFSGGGHIF